MSSTIGTTAWLCLALVLGACASGDQDRVRLPDGELSAALGERLSGVQSLDNGVRLQVRGMRLRMLPGTDRVRADFDSHLDEPGHDSAQVGRWALDARLQWSTDECSLRLAQVEMDLPPAERPGSYDARQREVRHAAALARMLEGQTLWARPSPTAGCAAMRLRVEARSVELVPVR